MLHVVVQVGSSVPLRDGSGRTPLSRDFEQLPDTINQGDCPQLVHVGRSVSQQRKTFGSEPILERRIQLVVYFLWGILQGDLAGHSGPLIRDFVDDYLRALGRNDALNSSSAMLTVRAGPFPTKLAFNGVAYRGVSFELELLDYSQA
ncbi:MAG TPA: hypothetical protein VGA61_04415 [Anaerolineae bacterium]